MKAVSSTGARLVKMGDGLLMYLCSFRLLIANLSACFLSHFLKAQEYLKIKVGLSCRMQETERNLISCLRVTQCLDSVFLVLVFF